MNTATCLHSPNVQMRIMTLTLIPILIVTLNPTTMILLKHQLKHYASPQLQMMKSLALCCTILANSLRLMSYTPSWKNLSNL